MKAAPLQSVFNAGEFSPRMDARVDFDRYPAAVSRALNMICLPQGGLTLRPGTRFVKATKGNAVARLIGFEPVSDANYVIEAGAAYLRFFRNQGQVTVATTDAVITNGTFDTDITGWTDVSTGSGGIVWDANSMLFNRTGDGYSAARQAIAVGAASQSEIHVIRFRIRGDQRAQGSVRLGTTAGAKDLAFAEIGWGWHSVAFTPGQGTVYLEFRADRGRLMRLNDVSMLSDEPMELPTPYEIGQVDDIRLAQTADVLYFFHPEHPVYKLQRRGDAAWSHVKVFFEDGPWGSVNPGADLGDENLISNFRFETGAEGWTKTVTGMGFVEHDPAQGVVFLRRRSPFNPTAEADFDGTAEIRHETATDDAAATHVLHFQIVGSGEISLSVGTTTINADIVATTAYGAGWYSVEFIPGATTFYIRFVGDQDLEIIGGVGGVFCYPSQARLLKPDGVSGSVLISVQGSVEEVFTNDDLGRQVRLEWPGREPGYGYITTVNSGFQVRVQLVRDLADTTPTETWQLGAWCTTNGFPRAGTFFQQRLVAGRTVANPQTIWGSQGGGRIEDMRPDSWVEGASTVEADDAFSVTLATKRVSWINWLIGSRRLIVGTSSGNWAFSSQGAALTPLDISATQQTSVDCADMEPLQIDDVGIFAHRAKRAVYDIGFSYEIEGFRASDLTILSEHVNKEGIEQLAYQAEPFSNGWSRLSDGALGCMTYKRSQEVVGWTPVELDGGVIVSMATIPGGTAASGQVYDSIGRDELWLCVRRTIDGATVHYIEVMEGVFDGPNRAEYLDQDDFDVDMRASQADAFYVDCGLTYKGAAATVISGLGHLEGATVKVVADGAAQQDKTVVSGSITIDKAASTVHVGLGYSWLIRSLKLPYGAQAGTAVNKTKVINKLGLVLKDSASFEYGVELDGEVSFNRVPFRTSSVPMGAATPLFTGETTLDLGGGYDLDPRIVLRGDLPLPFTLLASAPQMRTNESL